MLGDEGGIDLAADEPPISWRLLLLPRDGRPRLWEREVASGEPRAARHVKSSQANPTPATDGKTVVALFGSGTLAAYDVDGTTRWSVDLGKLDPGLLDDPSSEWGHGSSPVIFENLAIVQVDKHKDSFLAAYDLADRQAGLARRAGRAAGVGDPDARRLRGPRGAPRGRRLSRARLRPAHAAAELWRFKDVSEVKTPTPFVSDGLVDLRGRLSWPPVVRDQGRRARRRLRPRERDERALPRLAHRSRAVPTPRHRSRIAACSTPCATKGSCGVYELQTGALVYRERTGTTHSASPVASDGRVYLAGEDGQLLVLRAGRSFELLTRIDMGETVFATPAISRGTMYVRTRGHLYAIAAPARPAANGGS